MDAALPGVAQSPRPADRRVSSLSVPLIRVTERVALRGVGGCCLNPHFTGEETEARTCGIGNGVGSTVSRGSRTETTWRSLKHPLMTERGKGHRNNRLESEVLGKRPESTTPITTTNDHH